MFTLNNAGIESKYIEIAISIKKGPPNTKPMMAIVELLFLVMKCDFILGLFQGPQAGYRTVIGSSGGSSKYMASRRTARPQHAATD